MRSRSSARPLPELRITGFIADNEGYPDGTPISWTAPTYSERLSGLAKQIGLGRGRRASREGPEPVTPEIPPQSR
jgi:hypothetical protein